MLLKITIIILVSVLFGLIITAASIRLKEDYPEKWWVVSVWLTALLVLLEIAIWFTPVANLN